MPVASVHDVPTREPGATQQPGPFVGRGLLVQVLAGSNIHRPPSLNHRGPLSSNAGLRDPGSRQASNARVCRMSRGRHEGAAPGARWSQGPPTSAHSRSRTRWARERLRGMRTESDPRHFAAKAIEGAVRLPGEGEDPTADVQGPALWICAWAGRYRDGEAPSRGRVANCVATAQFSPTFVCVHQRPNRW
jgi:hypothetical protein